MRWRGPIAIEGRDTVDGRQIAPGGLEWDLPVPVMERPDGDSNDLRPIGSLTHIERHPDGILWGEGTLDQDPQGTSLEIGTDNSEMDTVRTEDGAMVMLRGRLRYVMVGTRPAWPECIIEVLS